MSVFTKRAIDVFAPTDASGNPRGASMGEVMVWGTEVERATDGAEAGRVDQATWAGLDAIDGTRAGQPGMVFGPDAGTHTDPVTGATVPNEGQYYWNVSPEGWRRAGSLERDLVHALNSGGTADAVEATSDGQFDTSPYRALITVNFTAANTGAMTLSIDGETPRALVTNTGEPIPAGYVSAGMSALVQIDSGGNYRLFSYGDAAAVQATVEALLIDAGAAAAAAQGYAADAAAASGLTAFSTVASLLADSAVLGYAGSTAAVIVSAGVSVTAQGYRYSVAASDATDYDLSTDGPTLVSNSGFEADFADWSVTGTTISSNAHSGTKAASVPNGGGVSSALRSDQVPVVAGSSYTAKAWLKGDVAASAGQYMRVYWFKSDGSASSTPYSNVINGGPVTTGYVQYGTDVVAPADAASASVGFGVNAGSANSYLLVDDVTFKLTTGAGVKLYVEPTNGAINPEMFGANGDGTDESTILGKVFSFSRVSADIVLTAGATYGISSGLTSWIANRRISGAGTIKVLSQIDSAIVVTGDGSVLRDFTLQGQNLCRRGVKAPVNNVDIEGLHVFDVYSDALTGSDSVGAFGIWAGPTSVLAGVIRVHGCEVRNVVAVPDEVSGNSVGTSRAIYVAVNTSVEAVWITDNLVDEVRGEDGDGIHIAAGEIKGNVFINGNKGSNVDRRMIKVQAYNATVIGNRYTQTGDLPVYPISFLAVQYANDCIVIGNHGEAHGFSYGITIGVSISAHARAVVMGNMVKGPSGLVGLSGTSSAYRFINMKNIIASGNVAENFVSWMEMYGVTAGTISDNTWEINDGVTRDKGIWDIWSDDTSTPRCSGLTFSGNRAFGTGDNYCKTLFLPKKLHNSLFSANVADFDGTTTSVKRLAEIRDADATDLVFTDNVSREDVGPVIFSSPVPSGLILRNNRNLGTGNTSGTGNNAGFDAFEQTADANRNITPGGYIGENILWSGTLTADRTLSMLSGGKAGDTFTITRTGAGAFNLNIMGLKNLAQNQWCKINLGLSGWYLAAFGSL